MSRTIDYFRGEHWFLSNFSPAEIFITPNLSRLEMIKCYTAEHAYQASKTTDPLLRLRIAQGATPGEAKQLGRKVTIRSDWEEIKESIMYAILTVKFRDPKHRRRLLSTGDAILVEGNVWHDNIWGNCKCAKCSNIQGKNLLGQILMKVRENIHEGFDPFKQFIDFHGISTE